MKVQDIPVISAIMKSHQNKVEKPTKKQLIKVLNIDVMVANRMERAIKNQSLCFLQYLTRVKMIIKMEFSSYLSTIKFDHDFVT